MAKPTKYGLASIQKRLDDATKLLLIAAEIEKARQARTYVAYLTIAHLTGLFSGGSPLGRLLGVLFLMDHDAGWASRTALVVHQTNGVWGEPGEGFFEMCLKCGLLAPNASPQVRTQLWEKLRDQVWAG